jgi:diguanylate cyclase (GGDEF)-like protein
VNWLLLSNVSHFVFCLICLSIMRFAIKRHGENDFGRHFNVLVILLGIYIVSDMLTFIFDGINDPIARCINIITMFTTVSMTGVVGFYFSFCFDAFFFKRKRMSVFAMIPAISLTVLAFVNIFTGWFYTVSPENVYQRKFLYPLNFVLEYIYVFEVIIKALMLKYETKIERTEKMRVTFILACTLSLTFGFAQAFTNGKIALHCLGLTISLFDIFIRIQDDQISRDLLTGINNRHALDSYIQIKTKQYERGLFEARRLYLLMIDINKFKAINDNHGHHEGDYALKDVARVLKDIGYELGNSFFIARYGGDEFMCIFESDSEVAVETLIKEIKRGVTLTESGRRHNITVSVGCSAYRGSSMSVDYWLISADKAMYVDKYGKKPE